MPIQVVRLLLGLADKPGQLCSVVLAVRAGLGLGQVKHHLQVENNVITSFMASPLISRIIAAA